jgi:prephenate dehydratase
MFFLEFHGHPEEAVTADALHELAQTTGDFRVLGSFRSNLF